MEGQEPTTPSPQAGDPTGNEQPATSAPQAGASVNDSERFQRELEESRRQTAGYRKTLRDTEAKLKQIEDAQLSDGEKAKKELDELRGYKSSTSEAVKSLNLQMAVERTARRLGVVDEEAAFALMDKSKIEYGEDGKPNGDTVQQSIESLLAAKPWLKPAPTPAPAAPNSPSLTPANPGKTPITGTLTSEDIKKMSQSEINARWAEVSLALQSGR